MNMISVILKKNNKDEITSVRITLNGNVITLDYSEHLLYNCSVNGELSKWS